MLIDSAAFPSNKRPPSLGFDAIRAGDQLLPLGTTVSVPPLTTRVRSSVTASDLLYPELVRFRFRVEGANAEWVDEGAERSAVWTPASPGRHRVLVEARNEDGVWSDTPAVSSSSRSLVPTLRVRAARPAVARDERTRTPDALVERGCLGPVVFLTAHGDVPAGVRPMNQGAVDFLEKPVVADELFSAIAAALARDAASRRQREELAELRARADTLSARERDVWLRVVRGQLNKQIAYDLGIVERTVKLHRAAAIEKLRAESLADLIRIA